MRLFNAKWRTMKDYILAETVTNGDTTVKTYRPLDLTGSSSAVQLITDELGKLRSFGYTDMDGNSYTHSIKQKDESFRKGGENKALKDLLQEYDLKLLGKKLLK
jgi:hypothetical protein